MARNLSLFFLVYISGLAVCTGQPQSEEMALFNPSVSSRMLSKLQFEAGFYSSYITIDHTLHQFRKTDGNFGVERLESNINYWSNLLQLTVGLNKKFAAGIDLNRFNTYVSDDNNEKASNFVWRLGPRIRWALFQGKNANLIMQHYLHVPIGTDSAFTTFENMTFGNQIVLTNRLGNRFLMTNQLDLLFYDKMDYESKTPVLIPYSFFLSYIINSENMVFTTFQYQAEVGEVVWKQDKYYKRRSSTNIGLGIQLRMAPGLTANVFYSYALSAKNFSGANSINVSFRFATRGS